MHVPAHCCHVSRRWDAVMQSRLTHVLGGCAATGAKRRTSTELYCDRVNPQQCFVGGEHAQPFRGWRPAGAVKKRAGAAVHMNNIQDTRHIEEFT
eukprot:scaffold9268_cov125-Isochrysis_galbana.AAC.3